MNTIQKEGKFIIELYLFAKTYCSLNEFEYVLVY